MGMVLDDAGPQKTCTASKSILKISEQQVDTRNTELTSAEQGVIFHQKGPFRGPENIENRLLLISMDNTYVPGSKLPLFPYNRGWSSTQ